MGFYTVSPSWGEFLGGWCNAVLYGLNILIFGSCMYILVKKRREGKHVSPFFFTCAIVQFIISTIHVALNLRLLMNAFLNVSDGPDASNAYLMQETLPEQIGLKALYFTNAMIGDAVLVWRMYVIWSRNVHIAVLPSLMVVVSAVTGFLAVSIIAKGGDAQWPLILKYLLVSWSLSIATQVMATCLIAFRIWSYAAKIPRHISPADEKEKTNYMAIVWIIVESGVVYTASTIILLAFFVVNSQASNIIGKALGQISSIVPTLIIVRVNLTGDVLKENDKQPLPVSIKFLNSYAPSSSLETHQEQSVDATNGSTLSSSTQVNTRTGLDTISEGV